MANISPQAALATWLGDKNGPAKLTSRQLELIARLEQEAGETEAISSNQDNNPSKQTPISPSSSLTKLLAPKWAPNEIINMFHEERQKIVHRGEACKALLDRTDSVLKEIISFKNLYLFVSPLTSQLHSECKNIIQERNDLRESYERLNSTLNKQEELRSIFRRMPDIKNQILSVLNTVFQGYQLRQDEEATQLDEYYGRFFIECRRIKELTSQLESCLSTSNTDELMLHLEEVYSLYFDIREQLIAPVFRKNLKTFISKANRNYCDLLRQTCASLVRLLRNEVQLFDQIFPSAVSATPPASTTDPSETSKTLATPISQPMAPLASTADSPLKRQAMNNFLEFLCKIFYEHLRPVIIHINHLETLAELYKLISETMQVESSETCYQSVMSTLAEDVQERMTFRAEVFIQESVLDYKPSGGDLAYPEKLEIVSGGELKDFQSMWYPTVQRTVLALFYLNRVFDTLTFRELAQEAVMACLKSLDIAQRLIDDRHGGTKIEAALFVGKHLAIIKDQLQSYGIEMICPTCGQNLLSPACCCQFASASR